MRIRIRIILDPSVIHTIMMIITGGLFSPICEINLPH